MVTVRTIQPHEAETYWQLRLEALRTRPEAFASSYEESVTLSMDDVKKRLNVEEENYILGAFDGPDVLIGTVGFVRERRMKLRHKAMIWGVYVSPSYQGRGIAKQLFSEVIERGRAMEGLEQLNLAVTLGNDAAVGLYTKLGFQVYGTEKNALKVQGQSYDELLMSYFYE